MNNQNRILLHLTLKVVKKLVALLTPDITILLKNRLF